MSIQYGSKEYREAMKKLANAGGLSGTQFGGGNGGNSSGGNSSGGNSSGARPAQGGSSGGYTTTSRVSGGDGSYVSSGSGGGHSGYDPYASYLAAIKKQEWEAEQARRRAIDAGVEQLQGQLPQLQQSRDEAARQAYIRAEQAKSAMPQQMAAMGGTGGLAETSMMGASTNYQNRQNELLQAYNNAVSGVNSDIASLKANGDLSIAQNADKYNNMVLDVKLRQAEQERQQREQLGRALGTVQGAGAAPGYEASLRQAVSYWRAMGYTDEEITRLLSSGAEE